MNTAIYDKTRKNMDFRLFIIVGKSNNLQNLHDKVKKRFILQHKIEDN